MTEGSIISFFFSNIHDVSKSLSTLITET